MGVFLQQKIFHFAFFLGFLVTVAQPSSARASTQKAFHLLNRLSFGPRPDELEILTRAGDAGIEAWINEQLYPEKIDDKEVDRKLLAYPSLAMSIGQLHENFPKPKKEALKLAQKALTAGAGADAKADGAEVDAELATELANARAQIPQKGEALKKPRKILIDLNAERLIRASESKRQLQEVLLDFWFNHFNVDFSKGQVKWYLIPYERDTLRPHLFGKFRDLLGAVAKSPAMLFYLDNFQSVRDGLSRPNRPGGKNAEKPAKTFGLNENYGRELLELHTLGVDAGYSQNDVRESARALTGWSIEKPGAETEFKFRARAHDEEAKRILSLNLPAGGGIEDGEKLLDMLAKNPATAKFIARKLCIKFISDKPPESAVQKLAAAFQKTDGDLRSVYRELFHLPEFWATSAMRSKIKTPWEYEISAIRAVGGIPDLPPRGPLRIIQSLTQMGEPLYRCQPPTGYKATSEYWVNPGALVTRINFGLALADDRIPEIDTNEAYFRKRLEKENVEGTENTIDHLNSWILAGEMRPDTRARLSTELNGDDKVLADPGKNGVDKPAVNLAKLLGLVIGSPEFQRR